MSYSKSSFTVKKNKNKMKEKKIRLKLQEIKKINVYLNTK